jgi:hypothetical protein
MIRMSANASVFDANCGVDALISNNLSRSLDSVFVV